MRQRTASGRPEGDAPFCAQPIDALARSLSCTTAGLSTEEAERRLREVGPNELQPDRRASALREFLRRFGNPLVLVLLVASAISAATGEVTSFAIVSVVVLLSVTLDFVQEHRAGRAAAALARSVALRAQVTRDGRITELPVSELVPGDLVHLSAGDLVPADARLVEAKDLFVNEAHLTGEPYPVEKNPHSADGASELALPMNAVFMGSSVVSGVASAFVCRTGRATSLGAIAEHLARRPPPAAFEEGTRRFGLLIMRLTTLLVLFVLLVNVLAHRPLLEAFLFAIALAVGLTPELLPMIVSVTLARGALRMAKEQVIVKRLAAIHDLGSMDVLCTDKTGTLTEARIRLERHVDAAGRDSTRALFLAWLNSHFETGLRSPLDDAILAHTPPGAEDWTKVDEVPFDFERRRVSVLVDDGTRRLLIVKGSPEDVLRLCATREVGEPPRREPLTEEGRAEADHLLESLASEGFRVLAIAWREVRRDQAHAGVADEAGLVFSGLAAFHDPPKEGVGEVLQALAVSGVEVKVVTGDNELVTRHLCALVGLPVRRVLLGREIEHLDELALAARVQEASLFCRVTPTQKSRIIRALRRRGHVVGFLGDGINDAPSLHGADVGISVDSAVDVAKDAADLILLRHDLGVLRRAVLEGRRTFANILKYLLMATSSNFGNMFSMAGASLFLPFLPMLPVQVLLNNLLYDLSELAIPLDTVEPEATRRPHRWDLRLIERFMLVAGPVSSLFDFVTFAVLLRLFEATERTFQTGWFVESMATQLLVIFLLRTRGPLARSRPSPVLAATTLLCLAAAVALPSTALGPLVGFVPLPGKLLAALALVVGLYLAAVEGAKRLFFQRWAPAGERLEGVPGPPRG